MKLNYPFLGHEPNVIYDFYTTDSEDLYLQNYRELPKEWYYKDIAITYSFNSYGHRCKNIEEIDLDNYILFAGCSHTVGVGLELEKTYAHQVAKTLNLDYYNIALAGTGIDVMTYNLIMWASTVKKLPKLLVIFWPAIVRFSLLHNNSLTPIVPSAVSDRYKSAISEDAKTFVGAGVQLGFFDTVKALNTNLINEIYKDTKIINLTNLHRSDYARDLQHLGIDSNRAITNEVLSYID